MDLAPSLLLSNTASSWQGYDELIAKYALPSEDELDQYKRLVDEHHEQEVCSVFSWHTAFTLVNTRQSFRSGSQGTLSSQQGYYDALSHVRSFGNCINLSRTVLGRTISL